MTDETRAAIENDKTPEYHVDKPDGTTAIFKSPAEAAQLAVAIGLSGRVAHIDVICWSEDAARAYGGDDAVEQYQEDPDASVFERIVIRAESQGRIP